MNAFWGLLLFFTIELAATQQESEVKVENLAAAYTFINGSYDYYFYCSANCEVLEWRVSNAGGLSHSVGQGQDVGHATFSSHEGELDNSSIILLIKDPDNSTDMISHLGALLWLQYNTKQENLIVTCLCHRPGIVPIANSVSINKNLDCSEVVTSTSTTIDLIISRDNLIDGYSTFVFICKANQSLNWTVHTDEVASYTTSDTPGGSSGTSDVQRHQYNETVYTKGLLLQTIPLIALLVLNSNETGITNSVTCVADDNSFPNTKSSVQPCPSPTPTPDPRSTQNLTNGTTIGTTSGEISRFPSVLLYFILYFIIMMF